MRSGAPGVYICVVSFCIGGTEKRMLELWERWVDAGRSDIHLVVSRHLFGLISQMPGLRHFREGHPQLVILECRSPISFLWPLVRLALSKPSGTVFHYPLRGLPLLHRLLGQRVVVSYTANVFFELYAGGAVRRWLFRLQAIGAERIDVLNPLNAERFRQLRWARDRVVLNPGSFIDTAQYRPAPDQRDWIVFSGRFVDGDPKNVMPYVAALPAIASALAGQGIRPRFLLLGEGPLETQIRAVLATDAFRDLDVEVRFEPEPTRVLQHARVFVSLQKGSNYPSKSLLEALACGALPVVTDVGETRLIAPAEFSSYVSARIEPAELARAIAGLFALDAEERRRRVGLAREYLRSRFDIRTHDAYYTQLYGVSATTPGADPCA